MVDKTLTIPLISVFLLFFIHTGSIAFENEDPVVQSIPDAALVGQGQYHYLWWRIYEARLYAPKGQWRQDQPFALRLIYARSLSGKEIAKRSIEQMRSQGFSNEIKLAAWFRQMEAVFPDVSKGLALTGIFQPGEGAKFWRNQTFIGAVDDPEFAKVFFDIWLSEQTSAPKLRRELIGLQ